jgi:hypothetical protein
VTLLAWLAPTRLTGLVAPMALWALHFVVAYSLAGVGCEHGWDQQRGFGLSTLVWSLLAITVVALASIAALGLHAWRVRVAAGNPTDPRERRRCFLAGATATLAVLAAIAVVFTSVPVFFLPPCQ